MMPCVQLRALSHVVCVIILLLVAPAISCHAVGVLLRSCAQDRGAKDFKTEKNFRGRVSASVKTALDREAAADSRTKPFVVLLPKRKVADPWFTAYYNELKEVRWAAHEVQNLCESGQLFLVTPMAARASIRGLSVYN